MQEVKRLREQETKLQQSVQENKKLNELAQQRQIKIVNLEKQMRTYVEQNARKNKMIEDSKERERVFRREVADALAAKDAAQEQVRVLERRLHELHNERDTLMVTVADVVVKMRDLEERRDELLFRLQEETSAQRLGLMC